jgi:hypothetical protein
VILWRLLTPTTGSGETYRHARKHSLNFEDQGGESHSPDDTPSESLSQIYHFLARAATSTTTITK